MFRCAETSFGGRWLSQLASETSSYRRGYEVDVSQIHQAIAVSLDAYGGAGCSGRVAQEFGDHLETAAARMRWARATVAVLDGQPVPGLRRTAAA
jgi:hypothetical protein